MNDFALTHFNRDNQRIDRNSSTALNWIETPVAQSYEITHYPFEGDTTNYLLSRKYVVGTDYYMENVPAIGTPHEDYPWLLFVHDTIDNDNEVGLRFFTRTWAMLPGFDGKRVGNRSGSLFSRKENESHVWQKPGIATTDSQVAEYYVDTATSVPTISGGKIKLYTFSGAPHNINANYNTATVTYNYYVLAIGNFGFWQQQKTYTSKIYDRGTNWIQVDSVDYGSGVYYL